jgi:hypothetical protein
MEQVLMMAMQTCQTFCERLMSGQGLTEYEMLMYESICRMLQSSCKYHGLVYETLCLQQDSALKTAEREHAKFMQEFLEKQLPSTQPDIPEQDS